MNSQGSELSTTGTEPVADRSVAPDVFNYLDYRDYIADFFAHKKFKNPNFSLRAFARKVKISHVHVYRIIHHKRHVSEKQIGPLANACGLNDWEVEYFMALVLWNISTEENIRAVHFEKLKRLRPRDGFRSIRDMEIKMLDHWFVLALLELMRLPRFQLNTEWISTRFGKKVSVAELDEAISLLRSLGLIEISGNKVTVLNKTLVSSPGTIPGEVLRDFHKKNIPVAIPALDHVVPEKREISTMSVAVSPKAMQEIQKRLRDMRAEILEYIQDDKDQTEVYQLNIQFFPMTEGGSK